MDFDIITSSLDNIGWAETFILSMSNTISDINRKIIIVDSSLDENYHRLLRLDKRGLNIQIVRHEKGFIQSWMYGIEQSTSAHICVCHIDIVFLLKNWDEYLKQKIAEGYSLVSSCTRTINFAESVFSLSLKNIFEKSGFAHDVLDWDEKVLPKPPRRVEMGSLTYYNALMGTSFLKLNQCLRFPGAGHIVLDDIGRELLYHSFYSTRNIPTSSCPVMGSEKEQAQFHLDNLDRMNGLLRDYVLNLWPEQLNDHMSRWLK